MNPQPVAAPVPATAPPSSDLNIPQIAAETGYSESKIMADIRRTGAQTKEQLYPSFYGAGRPGIEPDAAAIGGGYDVQPDQESAEAVPDDESQEGEAPQRVAARDAMAGRRPMPQPAAPEEEESALGVGAEMRPPLNVHERARRMRGR